MKSSSTPSHSALRNLPSMERILTNAAFAPLIGEFGRDRVRDAAAAHLAILRRSESPFDEASAVAAVHESLSHDISSTLRRVINGSGVIVSRGELVEIGGSFRVPDVIQQGGAKPREVGTTNRTRAGDYAEAVSRKTAAMLRVHRSNFDIVGFTGTPSIEELVEVAREKK